MKWQYLVEELAVDCTVPIGFQKPVKLSAIVQKRLNELGAEGWELVEAAPPFVWPAGPGCNPPPVGIFYFKRPAP